MDLKKNLWIWQITALSVVLGMLLAAALKTQQVIRVKSGIPTTRFSGLVQVMQDEKEKNKLLREEITSLRAKADEYEKALGEGTTRTKTLSEELRRAKFLAGLSPAEGPGIEIVLKDSSKSPPKSMDDPYMLQEYIQQYIIHDFDLRNLVNELLANGAEAIAIGDKDTVQRVTSRTGIRCVSGVIRVNEVPMGSPFTIVAIGPPNAMKSGLSIPGGYVDQFRVLDNAPSDMIKIKLREKITIPAFSGNTAFIYAGEPGGEKETKK